MSDLLSSLTYIVKRSTEVLMIQNPRWTCIGVTFGGFLKVLIHLFDPIIRVAQYKFLLFLYGDQLSTTVTRSAREVSIADAANGITKIEINGLANLHPMYLILTGIFLFNIPNLSSKNILDPIIENALAEIDMGVKRGLLSKASAKMEYTAIITAYVQKVVLEIPKKATSKVELE